MTTQKRWPKTPEDFDLESAPKVDWKVARRAILRRDVGVWFKFTDNRSNTRMGRIAYLRQQLGAEFCDDLLLEAKAMRMPPRRDGKPSGYSIYLRKNQQKKEPEIYRAEDAEPKVQAYIRSLTKGAHVVTLYRVGHGRYERVFATRKQAEDTVKQWNGARRLPTEKDWE